MLRKIYPIFVVGALLLPALLDSGSANAGGKCSISSGSYLVTIDSPSGFAGRAVLSFHDDGTISEVNSSENGSTSFAPFTGQLGTWECTGDQISARTIDFTLPTDGSAKQVVRIDYSATVTKNAIRGTSEGRFYPLETDPQLTKPAPTFSNRFRGRLIKAQ